MRRLVVLLICSAVGAIALAQTPASPAGPPTPAPPAEAPPAIGIDRAIAEVVARMLAAPRFEEHVEVRDRYQEAIDAYLREGDLGCGATASRPAAQDDMNRLGSNPRPPSADLLAAGKLAAAKVKGLFGKRKPRFFLYAVRRRDAPGRLVYVVRDGRIPEAARTSMPGTEWELVDGFAERDKAAEALRRLQRGFASTSAEGADAPRALWAASGCSR